MPKALFYYSIFLLLITYASILTIVYSIIPTLGTERFGCHFDRKQAYYICETGELAGQVFHSKKLILLALHQKAKGLRMKRKENDK